MAGAIRGSAEVTGFAKTRVLDLGGLEVEGVRKCVHCGLCLSYCPTYSELGTEMDSPRGRIVLVKSLAEGRIALTDSVAAHLSLCLDCRACETVCPAGVPYGQLIEAARAEIERQRPGGPLRRTFRRVAFNWLLERPRLLGLAATALRGYQLSGLRELARASGLGRLLPARLRAWEALLPEIPPRSERAPLPERVPAQGTRMARVALLTGCIQQALFASQNHATVRVLARNGAEVVVPRDQGCCGALHAHAGDRARAREMARRTIDRFEATGADAVIVNAAGCGAHAKGYWHLLGDDQAYGRRALAFSRRVQDVSEFLSREPLRGPLHPVTMTCTYHDPCHVVHGQKIQREPRQLLVQIPGLRLVELKESDWCCGSAGTYNLTHPEMAARLSARKVQNLQATGADAVVTANPGCIIQIAYGLRAKGSAVRVLHLVDLLDLAYAGGWR